MGECVEMPAGVSWPRYLRMFGASTLAMFAGAQVVHQYYLPDLVRDEISLFFIISKQVCKVLGCIEMIITSQVFLNHVLDC